MSTHNNKLHIEVFTEPKNCSNCCLQSPPGKLFLGYDMYVCLWSCSASLFALNKRTYGDIFTDEKTKVMFSL